MKFLNFLKRVFVDHWQDKLLALFLAVVLVSTANIVFLVN